MVIMASYGYEAVDKSGKVIKGSIEADNEDKAKADLRNKGLLILSVQEQSLLTKDINLEIGGYPQARDLSVFCRQFVSMLNAGVTIIESLILLGEQTENKQLQKAIQKVRISVEKGETLADSMTEFPKVFPSLMVNMVAAGEASGSLEVALERMAVQFEKSAKTKALVKKAMIYPIVLCFVMIIVMVVMLVVVIPGYAGMFEELGSELPAITVAVVNLSGFVKSNWLMLLLAAVGIAVGMKVFVATDTGKYLFARLALKIPVVKNLVVKSASSQMSRTLSTLIASGVPLIEAVEITAGTMGNLLFKDALLDAKEQLKVGVPLSVPLETCGLFPPMVYHMTRIGEESGNTEDMLTKMADYYDEEVELATQSLMAAMEPMIIVIAAVFVGFLIMTIMSPMVKMYDALDNL